MYMYITSSLYTYTVTTHCNSIGGSNVVSQYYCCFELIYFCNAGNINFYMYTNVHNSHKNILKVYIKEHVFTAEVEILVFQRRTENLQVRVIVM